MRSRLYFKIFLWFWVAMAVVGLAFMVSTITLQEVEDDLSWREFVVPRFRAIGQVAIRSYQNRGAAALGRYFDLLDERNATRVYLFDDSLNELSGETPPPVGAPLVEAARQSNTLIYRRLSDRNMAALRLTGAGDETFVLLADWPLRGQPRPRSNGATAAETGVAGARPDVPDGAAVDNTDLGGNLPSGNLSRRFGGLQEELPAWEKMWQTAKDKPAAVALRMGAVLVVAGILCFGLARYLTAPVARLSDVTHRFAAGDLRARVGAPTGTRRDELTQLGHDFDLMADQIESLVTAQRQLLSDVSHELRLPLARLNVALALARQKASDDALAPLNRIEVEAEQLNTLIGQVLVLARLESGAAQPDSVNIDLENLVADVVADADFEVNGKGTSVRVVESTAATVRGDEALLRSAIENVVCNAARYTGQESEVDVALRIVNAEPQAVIVVRDHGPGVPEEHLAELFEPFYRIADARDRESGGTGLGLSITDRAVRLHQGTVKASNAEDGGLEVEIRLPRSV